MKKNEDENNEKMDKLAHKMKIKIALFPTLTLCVLALGSGALAQGSTVKIWFSRILKRPKCCKPSEMIKLSSRDLSGPMVSILDPKMRSKCNFARI